MTSSTTALPGPRVLAWYRVAYAACIAWMSVATALEARGLSDHHLWLGSIETLGALLLLRRRTQLAGLVTLLGVYAFVAFINLAGGHIPVYLALYAAAAIAIVQFDRALTPR